MNKKSFLIFLLLLIISIILIVKSFSNKYMNYYSYTNIKTTGSKCDIKSCGALDPVSNPAYNMQQIVKQSILLEEHLTNKNKRCRDCITKHFLHIIGLAEEAQMLATNDPNKYPLINESVELYNSLFKEWLKIKDDETKVLGISDKLRIHRKKLIAIYFFNDSYDLDNFSKSSMG
jgi:hypothetical protein